MLLVGNSVWLWHGHILRWCIHDVDRWSDALLVAVGQEQSLRILRRRVVNVALLGNHAKLEDNFTWLRRLVVNILGNLKHDWLVVNSSTYHWVEQIIIRVELLDDLLAENQLQLL